MVPLVVLLFFLGVDLLKVVCFVLVRSMSCWFCATSDKVITVALGSAVCMQPVVHAGTGSLPIRLLLLLALHVALIVSFCGTGGGVGSPVPTKLQPIPGNVPTFACSWIPAGIA